MMDKRHRKLLIIEDEKVIAMLSLCDTVNRIVTTEDHTIRRLQGYLSGNRPTR